MTLPLMSIAINLGSIFGIWDGSWVNMMSTWDVTE